MKRKLIPQAQKEAKVLSAKRLRRLRRLHSVIIPKIDIEKLDFALWSCGTYACLGGYAAADKSFKRAGLSLVVSRLLHDITYYTPSFDETIGMYALTEFFMITTEQSQQLFTSTMYCSTLKLELDRRKQYLADMIIGYGGKTIEVQS